MTNQVNEQDWLIRDTSNVIRGPFKHAEVLQLIKKGQIKGKTEISRANSYWFAMEEKVELARFFPELGLKAPEESTQMTATLTQAADMDAGVEITQFTAAPTRKELLEQKADSPDSPGKADQSQMQWLDPSLAEEFGLDLQTLSVQTETAGKEPEKGAASPLPDLAVTLPSAPPPEKSQEEKAKEEMLKRATVKADTLPSEHKNFTGERPKPINAVLKNPMAQAPAQPQPKPSMVTVPVSNPEASAKILNGEELQAQGFPRKKIFLIAGAVTLTLMGAVAGFLFLDLPGERQKTERRAQAPSGSPVELVKKSLLLFNLESTKEALSDFEMSPNGRGSFTIPLAQALMKKEFLYDADGAFMALQTARSLAKDKKVEAEVDNLISIYRYERDGDGALEGLRRVTAAFPAENLFRYNLALSLMRSGQAQEAIQQASGIVAAGKDDSLTEHVAVLLGWSKEVASKGADPSAEAAYLKALDANPGSDKARLGLALHRLKRGGLKESEADFKAFLEALPEIDPPSKVVNFRRMNDGDFYVFARSQIRELNVPMGAAGKKPSAIIMAVDAVLSCLQSRTGEAGKILDSALSAAPGDTSVLKAVGFHRWKEGRYPEVIDLLKDLKDRNSFALNLLLGKSYVKVGRRDLAESHFENLTAAYPNRSEGWSLLGEIQLQQGREDVAKRNLENALERSPMDLVALRGLERLGVSILTPELALNLPF